METKEFTSDIVQKIADFFAEKYNNPQLAFEIIGCSGSSSSDCSYSNSCCCSCGGASDIDCGAG